MSHETLPRAILQNGFRAARGANQRSHEGAIRRRGLAVKSTVPLLAFCLSVLSATGVLVAYIYWKPLLWYHWLLAGLAVPAFVFLLSAVALAYVTLAKRQPRIVLSSPAPVFHISNVAVAAIFGGVLLLGLSFWRRRARP